jgi:hypothetical protein
MELVISPNKMKSLQDLAIKNAESNDYTFNRSKEMTELFQTLEAMKVRKIEIDLSPDSDTLL